MIDYLIKALVVFCLLTGCRSERKADGVDIERQILSDYHLSKDFASQQLLEGIMKDINCVDSSVLGKKLVPAIEFHSWDTSEILLIPFISNNHLFKSSAYSDVDNRFILINPSYIREFTAKNTLSDSTAYEPVLKLMLLHEIGHFILGKTDSFDEITSTKTKPTGERLDNTEPEFLSTAKMIELSADSLAIDLVKRVLKSKNSSCLDIAFDVERIVPGMQFQLSGTRMIGNFGSDNIDFLHDPSNDHPNLELRITFMNYFLFPSSGLQQMIDDYLYNRTVRPVHQQEFNPRIFQGQEKDLPVIQD